MPWAVCYRRREPGLHLVSCVALDKSLNRSELPYLLYNSGNDPTSVKAVCKDYIKLYM